MNFHLNGQKTRQKICTKYLGVLLDKHLLFKDHINALKQKLNRANGILASLRHHLPSDILKIVYYSLFDTHLRYPCQWHTSHGSKSSKQSPMNNKFQGRKISKCISVH